LTREKCPEASASDRYHNSTLFGSRLAKCQL
jgi:hypothetical protein